MGMSELIKKKNETNHPAMTVLNYLDLNDDIERLFDDEEEGNTEETRNKNRTLSVAETGDNDKKLSFKQKAQEKGSWVLGTVGPEALAVGINAIGKGVKSAAKKGVEYLNATGRVGKRSVITDRAANEILENGEKISRQALDSQAGLRTGKTAEKSFNNIHFDLTKNPSKEEKEVVDILNNIIDNGVENIDLTEIVKKGANEISINQELGKMRNELYEKAMNSLKGKYGGDKKVLEKLEKELEKKLNDYIGNYYGTSVNLIHEGPEKYRNKNISSNKEFKQENISVPEDVNKDLDYFYDYPSEEFTAPFTNSEKVEILKNGVDERKLMELETNELLLSDKDKELLKELRGKKDTILKMMADHDASIMDDNAFIAFENFLNNKNSIELDGMKEFIKQVGKDRAKTMVKEILESGKEKEFSEFLRDIGSGLKNDLLKPIGFGLTHGGTTELAANAISNGAKMAEEKYGENGTIAKNRDSPMYDENGEPTYESKSVYRDKNGAKIQNDKPTVSDRVYLDNLYRQVKTPGPVSFLKKATGFVANLLDINENDPSKQDMDLVDTLLRSIFTNKQIDALSNTQKLELLRAVGQEYSKGEKSKMSSGIRNIFKQSIDANR